MPFAIEILLPLETSDLNPGGICAPDCRLILPSLSPRASSSRPFLRRAERPSAVLLAFAFTLAHFGLVISLLRSLRWLAADRPAGYSPM